MNGFSLRDATPDDLPAIFGIYNEAVLNGTATWDLEEVAVAEWRPWLDQHAEPYCALVAVVNGRVVGWGSLSRYRPRPGYRYSVEDTLYIEPGYHGRGIGAAILEELLGRARAGGFRTVLAKISSDNKASVRLHARYGFFESGRELEVGYKFERWLDLVTMQLLLTD